MLLTGDARGRAAARAEEVADGRVGGREEQGRGRAVQNPQGQDKVPIFYCFLSERGGKLGAGRDGATSTYGCKCS